LGQQATQHQVTGPGGRPLRLIDLPSPRTKRWVVRRKAEVVAAVRGGLITLDEARRMYALTTDEFMHWETALDQYGLPGLRVGHWQQYRNGAVNTSRYRT
jgi:hypothetical protein